MVLLEQYDATEQLLSLHANSTPLVIGISVCPSL